MLQQVQTLHTIGDGLVISSLPGVRVTVADSVDGKSSTPATGRAEQLGNDRLVSDDYMKS